MTFRVLLPVANPLLEWLEFWPSAGSTHDRMVKMLRDAGIVSRGLDEGYVTSTLAGHWFRLRSHTVVRGPGELYALRGRRGLRGAAGARAVARHLALFDDEGTPRRAALVRHPPGDPWQGRCAFVSVQPL